MNNTNDEINRLHFENILWITFAILSILNIRGDYDEELYIKTNNNLYEKESNKIFEFTLIVTLFIYLYFFERNYKAYKRASNNQQELYMSKVIGSVLLISGVICLIYFQVNQTSFIGSPAI